MKNYLLLVLLAVCALQACNKELSSTSAPAPQNPGNRPITTGVGATINNVSWAVQESTDSTGGAPDSTLVPPGTGNAGDSIFYYASYTSADSTELILLAGGQFTGLPKTDWAKLLLWVKNFSGPGTYPLGGTITDSTSYAIFSFGGNDGYFDQYYTGEAHTGVINITSYSKENSTISGDFSFTAASALSPDSTINVQNGTFKDVPIQ